MAENGVYLDYSVELRTLMYLSDAAADRMNKRKEAQKLQGQRAKARKAARGNY